jgi:hypothetical protein
MTFYLQYRDAQSNEPLVEYQSPLPLPVPRRGETVTLFDEQAVPQIFGTVDRVHWGFRPAEEVAGAGAAQPTVDIQARVWLTRETVPEPATGV